MTKLHKGWQQLRIVILNKKTATQELILSWNHIMIYKLLCRQRKIPWSLRKLKMWMNLPNILENPKKGD